jgi:hypothetical protein
VRRNAQFAPLISGGAPPLHSIGVLGRAESV